MTITFIVIGIISTIIAFVYYQCKFEVQSNWICVNVDLESINDVPHDENSIDYDYKCYGTYIATIDNVEYALKSDLVSEPSYIDKHATFYINPTNYNDYHEEYPSFTKYVSLVWLAFSCCLTFYVILYKSK